MSSVKTFLNSKSVSIEKIRGFSFVIIGVPYEKGCAGRKGTSLGPEAIRKASLQYSWPKWDGFYEPKLDKRVLLNTKIADIGDIDNHKYKKDQEYRQLISDSTRKVIQSGGIPIILGGDHSISFDVLRAFDQKIQVIHLDAHGDYQRIDETDAYPSGVVMRKVNNLANISKIIQIGMRGFLNSEKGFSDSRNDGNIIIPWEQYKIKGVDCLQGIINKNFPVYISIDTDFLDPSICPGTTVPEPDGALYSQTQELISTIATKYKVVGLDIVELNPKYDLSGISSLHVAKLLLDFMVSVDIFKNE